MKGGKKVLPWRERSRGRKGGNVGGSKRVFSSVFLHTLAREKESEG